jgi:hypothetical protein
MDLLRQDMVGKPAGEVHDAVKGQGPGNKETHAGSPQMLTAKVVNDFMYPRAEI